jgi:putative oxidoreductase
MDGLMATVRRGFDWLNEQDWLLSTLARVVFAAVLARYFWTSALTKLSGPFSPTDGGFVQIFPRAMEAAGYDSSQLGPFAALVVLAGAWAEILLPALIILGLATRFAALGMIGFIAVQSLTEIYGHLAGTETIGAWFDPASDALILDQRALWVVLFVVLVVKGAGPLALDRLFSGKPATPSKKMVTS